MIHARRLSAHEYYIKINMTCIDFHLFIFQVRDKSWKLHKKQITCRSSVQPPMNKAMAGHLKALRYEQKSNKVLNFAALGLVSTPAFLFLLLCANDTTRCLDGVGFSHDS